MWKVALLRGAIGGSFTAILGLGGRLHADAQTASYNGYGLIIAGVAGGTSIIVALITIIVPWWLKRRDARDPDSVDARNEATDALAEALVRAHRERERADARADQLERKLAERDES